MRPDPVSDYTVQADGRRTALVEEFYENGQSTPFVTNQINWDYDALGRLIEEGFDSSDNSLDYLESFLFDLASNRVQKTRDLGRNQTIDETTAYEYDANDRLWTEAVDRLAADNLLTEYDWLGTQQIDKTVYTGTTKRTGIFCFFCLQFGAWGATILIVMHFQRGRTSDDGGSKSTCGCERNFLLPLHFSLREASVSVRRGT